MKAIVVVTMVRCVEARDWMNGILGVRRQWMINSFVKKSISRRDEERIGEYHEPE